MIAIDIGNSRVKWARFDGAEMKEYHALAHDHGAPEQVISEIVSAIPDQQSVWISCVTSNDFKSALQAALVTQGIDDIHYASSQDLQLGVRNGYPQPQSLGVDRWLSMLAAFNDKDRPAETAVCVISCGTAVTLDILSPQGEHLGGVILPGYRLMLDSLVTAAENLSLSEYSYREGDAGLAVDTQHGILNGVASVLVDGLRAQLQRQNELASSGLRIFITGGDGEWLAQQLAGDLHHDPYLVLKGLALIAEK